MTKELKTVEWISVKDNLPKKDGRYLLMVEMDEPCISNNTIIRISIPMIDNYSVMDKDWLGVYPLMEITHWMEIPSLER